MNRSIGVGTANGFSPYENTLEMVKNAGFKKISADFNMGTCLRPDFDDYVKSLKEELDKNEITCTQTHLPYYDLLKSSEITDEEMDTAQKNAVKGTALLGAKWAVFHPRTAISKGYDWDISRENTIEAIKPLIEAAEKYNTGIAIENIPVFPDCPTHRFYCSDPDDLCALNDYFKSDRVGVCWDAGHANLMSFDQPRVIKKIGSRIKCTHLHSNFKEQDWHLLPLFGFIDWGKIMKAFKEIGYTGDLNLEVGYVNFKAAQSFFKLAYDSVTILKDLLEEA